MKTNIHLCITELKGYSTLHIFEGLDDSSLKLVQDTFAVTFKHSKRKWFRVDKDRAKLKWLLNMQNMEEFIIRESECL